MAGSLVHQTPDEKLSNLLLRVDLIVGGEKVEGFCVFVHGRNFKREVNYLLGHCLWVKPADIK